LLTATAALVVVSACADTPAEPAADLETVSAATIIDGRPGQFLFTEGTLDMTGGSVYSEPNLCLARYETPVNGNSVISDAFNYESSTFRVTENKNFVKVSCRFIDTSLRYEANAEVGKITNCSAWLTDGRVLTGGEGRVVAAANNEVTGGEDPTGQDGGNAMISCTFPKDGG
jgi:hypothetical protein